MAQANNVSTAEELANMPHIGDTLAVVSVGTVRALKISVICIPISLSGGEYSRYAGVTDSNSHKEQFTHERMFPALIILDPRLTLSTPIPFWLSSDIRSVDHCVEGYLSKNATDEGDAAAAKARKLLVKGLLTTKANPDDLEARLRCQLGSNLSMTLLYLHVLKGASHGIGHQLGPLGVTHGDTSCILLPAVCKYNAAVNIEKQEQLKRILCNEPMVQDVLNAKLINKESADLGDVLRAIFDTLGVPSILKDVGVVKDQLDELARSCLTEVFVISNPRPINGKEDVFEVLNAVLGA
jgi:alcohol dehydrogenase class IV